MSNDITAQIQQIIIDQSAKGVFTAETIKHMHGIADSADKLRKENDALLLRVAHLEQDRLTIGAALGKKDSELDALRKREADLVSRESKMLELELTAKNESKRVDDHKNMVTLIFRNTIVKREMFGSGTEQDQYGNTRSMPTNESITVSVE